MSSNKNHKPNKSSKLAAFQIPITLPFKITSTFTRACLRYERDGHWNQREKIKYSIFISYFRKLFQEPNQKKTIRLYEMMSDMIITRNPNQCRSHHQKMEKYRNSIPQIIASVAEKYQPRIYKEMEDKYLVLIKGLLENQQKYIRTPAPLYPIKYIYTTFEPIVETKNTQKLKATLEKLSQKQMIQIEDAVQKGDDKDKEDRMKTADSYRNERLELEEDSEINQTPVMKFVQIVQAHPKLEGDSDPIVRNPNQAAIPIIIPPPQIKGPTESGSSRILNPQSKSFYEQQLKMLEVKKQWHMHNIQQLTLQLAHEKESIKSCDATIQHYRMARDYPVAKSPN